jgi:hypothetical protein
VWTATVFPHKIVEVHEDNALDLASPSVRWCQIGSKITSVYKDFLRKAAAIYKNCLLYYVCFESSASNNICFYGFHEESTAQDSTILI